MVTTGYLDIGVPASPSGEPPHAAGPQWTVQGEPITGALVGATGSAGVPLLLPSDSLDDPSWLQSGLRLHLSQAFNWEIGGVEPDGNYYNCPTASTFGQVGLGRAGAGRGEVQVEINVVVTSVGGLRFVVRAHRLR